MTKWETVFTEVLSSLVAGGREDLMDRFTHGHFESHAYCLTTVASIIADSATHKMRVNQLKKNTGDSNNE